jgi:5-methylthioadenosine/S-adenosylhomocysteine deaminase
MTLLIQNTTVLSPNSALQNHDVLINGQRIEAVQPTGQIEPSRAQTVIDGANMLTMPGFINGHCHAAMNLFRGLGEDVDINTWFNEIIWKLEANLTSDDVYWGTLLACAEMIESGVTTVADHYFFMDEVARAYDHAGMRANLVWAVFSAGTPDPAAKLRETLGFVERWQNAADGRIVTWLGPHAPYTCDDAFLRLCANESKRLGVGIHIHVSETIEQVETSVGSTGRTPIAVLRDSGVFEVPTILAHAAHPTDADIQIMVEGGATVAHCPKTFLKLSAGIAPVVRMREAGIPIGIGSDGVVSNNTLDILEQTRLAAMLQKHETRRADLLTIRDAFDMTWNGGSAVLHNADIGRIAPGALADVILMRTDGAHMQPLHNPHANVLYSARANDVDTVIAHGKVLMRGRVLQTLDKAAIVSEVRTRAERLVKESKSGKRLQTY